MSDFLLGDVEAEGEAEREAGPEAASTDVDTDPGGDPGADPGADAGARRASRQLRLRFSGKWQAVSNVGFREMLVWLGVPWLLSYVIVRKTMQFSAAFHGDDPSSELCIRTDGREEHVPTDGSQVDVTVMQPFERRVQCTCTWKDDYTMRLVRRDLQVGSMKKHPNVATITRRMVDANTIESTLEMKKLTDGSSMVATIILKRQK